MSTSKKSTRTATAAPHEPDLGRSVSLVRQLMAIEGPSGREQGVVDFITRELRQAGVSKKDIRTDGAHRHTPIDGEVGNLVLRLRGNRRAPRRMLVAHMDTVPICVGSKPKKQGDRIISADPKTGLGADNRAGVAVLLSTVLEIVEHSLPHPPLTFLWPVQEEIGLHGARHAQLGLLGRPRLAFNFDGGAPEKLTIGATGGYRMTIRVEGIPSHAGGAPEFGVSAIAIASLAIADLQKAGWHGAIQKGKRRGTSNIGVIRGGAATNVVCDSVEIKAEARSHSPEFRRQIVKQIEKSFTKAAKSVKNVLGVCGKVTFDGRLDYESFQLNKQEPCVVEAEAVLRSVGEQPIHFICNGGLDANWLSARGIPTVTMGCGQLMQHTRDEMLDVPLFQRACRIGLRLATGVR